MPNVFDLINAKAIAAYITTNPSNAIPYLGATLFPPRKKLGLDLAWIKGSRGLPISLRPSSFDAKATLRDRIGISKVETEMPFFREAMRIGEKDRQDLLRLQESENDAFVMPLIQQIFDDRAQLVAGAQVIPERMIMQLLSTGKISITDNREYYDYDYGMNPNHQVTLTGTSIWSDPASTPINDIMTWQNTIEQDTGTRPTRAICALDVWNVLLLHPQIKADMNVEDGSRIILTDAMLRQYFLNKLGLTITVYSKKYSLLDGSTHLFYPDKMFTLIPDGNLGNTWYGTTPEEADLMSGQTNAEVAIVNTGVAVTTVKEPHPVNIFTVVSEIVMPSFETIDTVFISKVLA